MIFIFEVSEGLFRGANVSRSTETPYLQERIFLVLVLFFLRVCCLIIGHSNCSEKQDCSLLAVQTDLRLVFLFPSPLLMLALCRTSCFRVWSISEFQASGSSCTIAPLGVVQATAPSVLPWVTVLLSSALINLQICWKIPHRFLPAQFYLYYKYHLKSFTDNLM